MENGENKNNIPSELEAFLAANKEWIDKFRRINEEVEEEMEELAWRKAQHPEMNDLEHQLEVTNRFIEENPDIDHVTLITEDDE